MDAVPPTRPHLATEIRALIRATEICLAGAGEDREAQLQREAFQERCERAVALARRLDDATPEEAELLDVAACRARDSLALSLDFFRRRTHGKA